MLKNYQIWHHREMVIKRMPPNSHLHELEFLSTVLNGDTKNYHAWTYRHWVVEHFDYWDNELEYTHDLITRDVRNNSAWSHRFTVMQHFNFEGLSDELVYVAHAISLAPQNPSPWIYIRGIVSASNHPLGILQDQCEAYVTFDKAIITSTQSTHACELLADIFAEKDPNKASLIYKQLGDQFDTIRQGLWYYKANRLYK